jgi:hypothetical protein
MLEVGSIVTMNGKRYELTAILSETTATLRPVSWYQRLMQRIRYWLRGMRRLAPHPPHRLCGCRTCEASFSDGPSDGHIYEAASISTKEK